MPATSSSGRSRDTGGGSAARRGPRRSLTRERVVDEAIAIVESDGLAALSMRSLAERLGVAPGTLYTYVPNRTALETLILDAVAAGDALPHRLPGPWWLRLEAWARQDLVTFRERPWVLELRRSTPGVGPALIAWLDSALRAFDGTGLPEQVKLDMIEALDAYVCGAAANDAQAHGGERLPDMELFPETGRAYADAHALRRAAGEGALTAHQGQFEFGLRCLIAGFRAVAEEYGEAGGTP
ncbi:TetR/AcrR family transcriptional regulator [Nocardiopsis flavescens]|uniref:Regulatory protein, tetR family n=1 Tax=Nocardiopsis flavescens TaxID=758803 RepID=A0A1M6MJU2_9ACTN|nr:TetR/AcrR family transcriptional regulator C-terminal domain-containing protein [Nocardiopsis flavescens]SHJ83752.1 regulatory protein, tetR family [Nocardiopsis flavescens]